MPHSDTLASVYLVCGLPKDPTRWSQAQPDHLPLPFPGALPLFWRPEVLSTTLPQPPSASFPAHSPPQSTSIEHSDSDWDFPPSSPCSNLLLSPSDLAQLRAKALKLSFPAEAQVIASHLQPPSTTQCFAFSLSSAAASPASNTHSSLREPLPSRFRSFASPSSSLSPDRTFYAASLQVWSHSDQQRSQYISKLLSQPNHSDSLAIAKALKAASIGKRFQSHLTKSIERANLQRRSPASNSSLTSASLRKKSRPRRSSSAADPSPLPQFLVQSQDEPDSCTENFFSDSDLGYSLTPPALHHHPGINPHHPDQQTPNLSSLEGIPLWLGYSLILISRYPIYDLMVDHLKINWARFHRSIGQHSREMLKILNYPINPSDSVIKLPVGAPSRSSSKLSSKRTPKSRYAHHTLPKTHFVCHLPGKKDLSNPGLEQVDFTMWPVFKSLSMSHLVSIYELALSPMGRVVFFSNYPAMLNMAVETFRILLECRGWEGLCQSVVHVRDVKIYLEDPGPFLLGMNSQMKPVAQDAGSEIMLVDIDTDTIHCPKPHPTAFTKGQTRMKIEKRLEELLGTFGGTRSVPAEFHEAFPSGRFRPLSLVEVKGKPHHAERILAPPEWNWDQAKTILAFDGVLSKIPRKGLAKFLKRRAYRQAAVLDPSAQHVQEIVRKHTLGFVDRRDALETKIWKLNRRLTSLISESMQWKSHFEVIQNHVTKLSSECQTLKTRLETERKQQKTLSGVVDQQRSKQVELENRLLETEQAWMSAQAELAKAHNMREELERQKEVMVSEMKLISYGGEHESILDEVVPRLENDVKLSGCLSRSSEHHPSLTRTNLQRLDRLGMDGYEGSENDDMYSEVPASSLSGDLKHYHHCDPLFEDRRTTLSRLAVIEAMKSIQERLDSALKTAGQLTEDELRPYDDLGTDGDVSRRATRSKLSNYSQDSRKYQLQRGRRKPASGNLGQKHLRPGSAADSDQMNVRPHSLQVRASPDSTVDLSPTLTSNATEDSGFGTSPQHARGVPLNRQKVDARTSAVSLLTPGSSIFDARGGSGEPPVPQSRHLPGRHLNVPLSTVLDDEESDDSKDPQDTEGGRDGEDEGDSEDTGTDDGEDVHKERAPVEARGTEDSPPSSLPPQVTPEAEMVQSPPRSGCVTSDSGSFFSAEEDSAVSSSEDCVQTSSFQPSFLGPSLSMATLHHHHVASSAIVDQPEMPGRPTGKEVAVETDEEWQKIDGPPRGTERSERKLGRDPGRLRSRKSMLSFTHHPKSLDGRDFSHLQLNHRDSSVSFASSLTVRNHHHHHHHHHHHSPIDPRQDAGPLKSTESSLPFPLPASSVSSSSSSRERQTELGSFPLSGDAAVGPVFPKRLASRSTPRLRRVPRSLVMAAGAGGNNNMTLSNGSNFASYKPNLHLNSSIVAAKTKGNGSCLSPNGSAASVSTSLSSLGSPIVASGPLFPSVSVSVSDLASAGGRE